jgi:hypothetical protein
MKTLDGGFLAELDVWNVFDTSHERNQLFMERSLIQEAIEEAVESTS